MTVIPGGKWLEIRPDETVCAAARQSLESRLMTVAYHLPLAAYHAEQDVEHVHRLRVSTRRAIAALKLYRDFLPPKRARWVKRQLKKVRRAAGKARDLDVLAERLRRENEGLCERVFGRMAVERRTVQPDIVDIAAKFRRKEQYLRRTAKLLDAIECGEKHHEADSSFGDWAAKRLAAKAERFFKSVPDEGADMAALHRFRIQAKELRYTMELLASAFGKELRETHYRTVEELQERLGKINDHVAARDRLRQWAVDEAEPELIAAFCELADSEVARLTAELGEWREWWNQERVEELRRGLESSGSKAAPGQ